MYKVNDRSFSSFTLPRHVYTCECVFADPVNLMMDSRKVKEYESRTRIPFFFFNSIVRSTSFFHLYV